MTCNAALRGLCVLRTVCCRGGSSGMEAVVPPEHFFHSLHAAARAVVLGKVLLRTANTKPPSPANGPANGPAATELAAAAGGGAGRALAEVRVTEWVAESGAGAEPGAEVGAEAAAERCEDEAKKAETEDEAGGEEEPQVQAGP